jgi:hypothetical protein
VQLFHRLRSSCKRLKNKHLFGPPRPWLPRGAQTTMADDSQAALDQSLTR